MSEIGNRQRSVRTVEIVGAALLICGRHAYQSALLRTESRGLHRRLDLPDTDPAQQHHHASSGLATLHIETYRAFADSEFTTSAPAPEARRLAPSSQGAPA